MKRNVTRGYGVHEELEANEPSCLSVYTASVRDVVVSFRCNLGDTVYLATLGDLDDPF